MINLNTTIDMTMGKMCNDLYRKSIYQPIKNKEKLNTSQIIIVKNLFLKNMLFYDNVSL